MITNYEIFDISALIILVAILSFYLYKNKSKLKTEGALLLYKTSWGVKLIDYIGKRYKNSLKVLSYVSIFFGYILMISISYLFANTFWSYLTKPELAETIKAPPIAPLIPYFPQLFGLSNYFPVFYGLYFIVAILIVATVHEFSHGIFARRYGVKIKSTGFAFLKYFPAIFGAFVEQDDKDMNKKTKFQQMSILSAGVFANLIITVLFFFFVIIYFNLMFIPSGVIFSGYSYSPVSINEITSVNGVMIENSNYNKILNITENFNETVLFKVTAGDKSYLANGQFLKAQENSSYIYLFEDAPAINVKLNGIIVKLNEENVKNFNDFEKKFSKLSPGEKIIITTKIPNGYKENEILLGENPRINGKAYLGVMFVNGKNYFYGEFIHFFTSLKQENLYFKGNTFYESRYLKFSEFFYYLLWWIVFINLLVALFNMLPLGILDGGRFFYLTILGITNSKKIAEFSFKGITYLILLLLALIMVRWVFAII
ncbi:MAG: site-2 protease family protein [Nanoarchaeota archaeon]